LPELDTAVPTLSAELAAAIGDHAEPTPRLVLDLDLVAEQYRAFVEALPGVEVFYAVKANPHEAVLGLLHELGSSFDVASVGEIELCEALGVPAERMSFGNTIKKSADIDRAFRSGVRMFAFDSMEELDKLATHAPGAVAFCRLTTDSVGSDWPLSKKFGTDPHTAIRLLTAAAERGMATGISFHVGSQQRDSGGWARALTKATWVIEELERRGIRLGLLNLGGGFPAYYVDPIPRIHSIGDVVREHLAPLAGRVDRIIAEPGRYMVADAGVFVTSVITATEREIGTRWLYVDAGVYGGLAETLGEAIRYRLTSSRDGDPTGTVVLAGPSCDSTDVLYEKSAYQLPVTLAEGDRLHLHAAGAYTTSYASTGFNGFAPPTIQIVGRGVAAPV